MLPSLVAGELSRRYAVWVLPLHESPSSVSDQLLPIEPVDDPPNDVTHVSADSQTGP